LPRIRQRREGPGVIQQEQPGPCVTLLYCLLLLVRATQEFIPPIQI
jgi:hypothetical protein